MKMKTIRSLGLCATFLMPAVALAAPSTAEVLGKLHHSDQHEIEMGKQAEKNGNTKAVKDYGKMLVKDHTAADKKGAALAKKEKIDLTANTPPMANEMASIPAGADFDKKFAQAMLDDHKRDVAEMTKARDATDDADLKKLLTEVVPVLQKHLDTAQKIVDGQTTAAK
jgi:putative membrane protein